MRPARRHSIIHLLASLALCGRLLAQEAAPLAPEFDVAEIRSRAEKNDPQAQTTLGTLYQLGKSGLKADYAEAMRLFQLAAQQGDPGAMYRIAYMHYSGQGVSQNLAEAVRWFKKSAQAGFAISQFTLANMFKEGVGVQQNFSEALRWYYYAAEQGYAPAQHQVGVLIFQGKGAPQDYIEGCKWFYIAAQQENSNAIEALTTVALPLMAREDMEQANKLAKEFKAQPPRAVPERPEPPPIYHELLARANAGDPDAQNQLSLLLQSGQPTTEDLREARKWIIKAAAGGNAESQHQLGSMYYTGQGMVKDFVAAYKWMSLAVNGGVTNAIPGRTLVSRTMTPFQFAEARKQIAAFKPTLQGASGTNSPAKPVQVAAVTPAGPAPQSTPANPPVAATPDATVPATPARPTTTGSATANSPTIEQLSHEAASGKAGAQLSLGLMYLHGKGVTANRAEALQWLEKSANQGHSPAQYWLATTFDPAHQNDRVKWMRRAADGGFGLAQFMVGQMYFTGQGVVQDSIEAYKWLFLASKQGNPAADSFLETVAPLMTSEQIDEAKRRAEEVAFRLKSK